MTEEKGEELERKTPERPEGTSPREEENHRETSRGIYRRKNEHLFPEKKFSILHYDSSFGGRNEKKKEANHKGH